MTRVAVGGAGAIGASVAYHLARLGVRDVVLCDSVGVAAGASGRAMGGVRQQFSTEAEVRLAQASVGFFEELGPPLFEQVGYLFVAASDEELAVLEARRALQVDLGVPVEAVTPADIRELAPGVNTADLAGGVFCARDGVGDPVGVTRELVRRAVELGVELHEGTPLEEVEADVRVVACGAYSADVARRLGAELPVRPLCRQLLETSPLPSLPHRLPMVIEAATGFHFRRRGDRLVLAMADPEPRWGFDERVDDSLLPDRLGRLAHRFPPGAGAVAARAWAGLYDMTPDAHPIVGPIGEGLFAACGFSGHGFMQAPAVGRALAELIAHGGSSFDLSPYAMARFDGDGSFEELMIL